MGEAATKIRIFSLAKELGMDSKVLIDQCRQAGLDIKGSALASISPEEKQLVMDFMAGGQVSIATTEPSDDLAPQRDIAPDVAGKQREIRNMTPREIGRAGAAPKGDAAPVEGDSADSAIDATPVDPPIAESLTSPAVVETQAEALAPPTSDAPPASEPSVPTDVSAEDSVPVSDETDDAVESDDVPASDTSDAGVRGHRREDYMPLGSVGSRMRDMAPRGTPTHTDVPPARREKPRSRPSLPGLAEMPTFKAVEKPKAAEQQKAQKPTIRLTPEQLELGGTSPLAVHMKKGADERTRVTERRGRGKGPVEFTDDAESPDRTARGGSLESSRSDRRKNRQRRVSDEDEQDTRRSKLVRSRRRKSVSTELKTSAVLEFPITVRTLSEAIGRPAKSILGVLFKRGEMLRINDAMTEELAWEVAAELGVELEVRRDQTASEFLTELLESEDDPDTLTSRPPVVTILGHVDHGKTSLLDKIRSTKVVDGEAGGITQHIRAYQIEHEGQRITFVDTPGHAAFGEMRARGANVTDIIVLVVAADDSVMPQTLECIAHAKNSGAPIIVALNKIDLPDVNEQRILADLANHGIQPQEWGGEIEVVRTSAITGQGIDDLLETILLTAEIGELTANHDRPALGVCLEAFRDEGVGPIAWLINQKGTLRVGDTVLCGPAYGRIRSMYNDRGETVSEIGPATPVKVAGLDIVPGAGDRFFVLDDIEQARALADEHRREGRAMSLASRNRPRNIDDILNAARQGEIQDLNVILKADTPGSIEALKSEIGKFEHPEVRIKILHDAVGGVNESDVYLASASDAVIVAFHVIAEDRAMQLADQEGVEIRRYDIIYEVTDQIKRSLEGLLRPEQVQVATGRAIVLQTFSISRVGTIAGCRVLNGTIERNNRIHVIRDQKVLNDYPIASLKRVKDDAKEVRDGMECGIRLDGFNDVKEGDLLEAFRIDIVKRTLD